MNPVSINAPRWLRRLVEWRYFEVTFGWIALVLILAPVLIWRLPAGLLWVLGLIIGFAVGYWLARAEWRTRGYVPSLKRLDELNRE